MATKYTGSQFVATARAVHGDRYDYSRADYANNRTKVAIACPIHGVFYQEPRHHLSGVGCPRCKGDASSRRQRHDRDRFIASARAVHGDRYDYSRADYRGSSVKVEIGCPDHGGFRQTPNNHISKRAGCPKCAGKSRTTAEFIAGARAVHGDRFTYERTQYHTIKASVVITCQKHGDFTQAAEGHLIGNGCWQCWREHRTSRAETDLADWIESLGPEVRRNVRGVLADRSEVDIYLPEHRFAIEYNGCYWHSDRIEGDRRGTADKHDAARRAGIRLATVWEDEWLLRPNAVKRHLAHAIGLSDAPRIHARACEISEWSGAEANRFYAAHHLQGPCRGSALHLVLRTPDQPVASMSFALGNARRGSPDWELTRYATSALVRGGASRLFARFVATHDPETVWSFSDDRAFTGEIYPTLGFMKDGVVTPDYRVIELKTMTAWHKSAWQRRHIPARLRDLDIDDPFDPKTDPRTERAMQDLAGVVRVWDAGKTRWRWDRERHPSREVKT
jgi:hypothetical protein